MLSNEGEIDSTNTNNGWLECNSKSRPGLKYYFNTVTGESVWNISDTEVEKACKRTEQLEKHLGQDSLKCPEPTEQPLGYNTPRCREPTEQPPMENQWNNLPTVYNKQIINNQFPNQFTNIYPFLRTVPLGGVWENTCQVPVFIVPPVASQNVGQVPLGMTQGNNLFGNMPQVANFSTSVGTPGGSYNNTNHFNTNRNDKNFYNNNRKFINNRFKNKFKELQLNKRTNDLRQKLIRKRSFSDSNSQDLEHYAEESMAQVNTEIPDATTLDLTPLKQMSLTKHTNIEQWFVVVDIDVILNDFKFFNNLIGADQNCFTVVPYHVYKELEELGSSNCVITSRIFRFLKQQIQCDLVSCAGEIINPKMGAADKTFRTCLKLIADQNYVVLISNNPEITRYKHTNNFINVMTSPEIKKLLHNARPAKLSSPTMAIKIIVPNQTQSNNTDTSSIVEEDSMQNELHLETNETQSKSNVVTDEKNENLMDKEPSCITQTTNTVPQTLKEKIQLSVAAKKREIRLVRSTSNQKTNNDNNEQKYRWRKRRRGSQVNLSANSANTEENDKVNDMISNVSTKSIVSSDSKKNISNSSVVTNPIKISKEVNKNVTNTKPEVSVTKTDLKQQSKKIILKQVTMFEIENIMEERLRIHSDEWISRFVQIMEEVLKVKLLEYPPFQNNEYPPPWNLQEAARCVISKFNNYFNVVDAANKLSFILYKVSDEKGTIDINIEPTDYMEMYSYGVYLVDTLMDVNNKCEELNFASDSLKKLLIDIKQPNFDSSHNDTFVEDEPHNVESENMKDIHQVTADENKKKHQLDPENIKESLYCKSKATSKKSPSVITLSPESKRLYNLRSNKRNKPQRPVTPTLQIDQIDDSRAFLETLNLRPSLGLVEIENSSKPASVQGLTAKSVELPTEPASDTQENINELNNTNTDSEEKVTVQPKIVRNFTFNTEYEERFKKRINDMCEDYEDLEECEFDSEHSKEYYDDDDEEYYEDDYAEGSICQDDEMHETNTQDETSNISAGSSVNRNGPLMSTQDPFLNNINYSSATSLPDLLTDNNYPTYTHVDFMTKNSDPSIMPSGKSETNTETYGSIKESAHVLNKHVHHILTNFLKQVIRRFDDVRLFCEENLCKQKNPEFQSIKDKAEKISCSVQNILQLLESILKREDNNESDNMQNVFKKMFNKDIVLDEGLVLKYKKIITLHIEQARLFIKILKLISKKEY